jgi:hypothetical protein
VVDPRCAGREKAERRNPLTEPTPERRRERKRELEPIHRPKRKTEAVPA